MKDTRALSFLQHRVVVLTEGVGEVRCLRCMGDAPEKGSRLDSIHSLWREPREVTARMWEGGVYMSLMPRGERVAARIVSGRVHLFWKRFTLASRPPGAVHPTRWPMYLITKIAPHGSG